MDATTDTFTPTIVAWETPASDRAPEYTYVGVTTGSSDEDGEIVEHVLRFGSDRHRWNEVSREYPARQVDLDRCLPDEDVAMWAGEWLSYQLNRAADARNAAETALAEADERLAFFGRFESDVWA